MQQHKSEGATRPLVSPTAWQISWAGLEDSDTATLYRPMWGLRRLVVGSDTAQCELATRCVYIATVLLLLCKTNKQTNTPPPDSSFFVLSRSCACHWVTQWNQHRESVKTKSSQTLSFFDGCQRVRIIYCSYALQKVKSLLLNFCHYSSSVEVKMDICLSNVLLTYCCSVRDTFRNGGFPEDNCERFKFSRDSKYC